MTTMLEKMARAMYERPVDGLDIPMSFDGLDAHDRQSLVDDARAALMAMREPDDETVEAAASVYTIAGTWTAMIDAILATSPDER